MVGSGHVNVYTVNGVASGASSSLPDWLTRKRAAKKGKRAIREHVEGTIELIQHFEFPEASNRIKTTRDGHHAIATGTYKPQMRVWDLDQLTLKFERHSDAENVDFLILSDDWTKSIHLQNDRTVELHTQGGFYHRMRIPRFGRALAYHSPTCDALFGATGNEVYRLNLYQGRFFKPLVLQGEDGAGVAGVNTVDVNQAHQLFAFGIEGDGTVQFWDPRSRDRVGLLKLPMSRLLPTGTAALDSTAPSVSVTALASRLDGLSYAIGTSTGHTLLYDLRATRPLAVKDQGYGLPVKCLTWIEGGGRMAGDGMVLSADKKVIKIWERHSPSVNFVSMTPATDLNDVHHVAGSGLIMVANEGIQMTTYYVPQLGPAPRWASFLENITEEMEGSATRSAYEDYKFVGKNELRVLGLDRLVGTAALKPYMHGYFLKLKLYDTARAIANPFAYEEHREKVIREKMEKLAEGRIRAPKDKVAKMAGVKVNKALAEKIRREEEMERKKLEKRQAKKLASSSLNEWEAEVPTKPSLLTDPRFKMLFEDPEFVVDENSREYALLNPSAFAQRRDGINQKKTVVEEEETDGGGSSSSDGLGKESSESDGEEEDEDDSDSSAAGELDLSKRLKGSDQARGMHNERQKQVRLQSLHMVPADVQTESHGGHRVSNRDATFGQRRAVAAGKKMRLDVASRSADGGMEISWVPSSTQGVDEERSQVHAHKDKRAKRNKISMGVGLLEKGVEKVEMNEHERRGRTERRKGVRSGSKNVFRRLS